MDSVDLRRLRTLESLFRGSEAFHVRRGRVLRELRAYVELHKVPLGPSPASMPKWARDIEKILDSM